MSNVSLRESISSPESKRRYTRWVFATIADRYDLVNVLLSFNRDRAWKRRMVARANLRPGERALDVACGTADITLSLARSGARAIGLDVTPQMIELAVAKTRLSAGGSGGKSGPPAGRAEFLVGDMMDLPFADCSFDLVTAGYGLRNVPEIAGALREIHRVLKPGGRFLSLDFDRPPNRVVRRAYLGYLAVVGSVLGWALYREPNTYRYIPETIRQYPGAPGVVALLRSAGFGEAGFEPVFGGFMALHYARR